MAILVFLSKKALANCSPSEEVEISLIDEATDGWERETNLSACSR
jgi:hypothetical protein